MVYVHHCLSGLVSTVKHLFYLGGNQNGHCMVMSSPSMVAAVARETLIDKVVSDIRTLLRHGFISPEDGGNVDEALFNCLLACQSSSPWDISLSDLFDGDETSCSASMSDRGAVDEDIEDGGGNDRRLLCHLLKLSLRRQQLSHLLKNFCSSSEVVTLWYSENAFIRRASLTGSLLLLVRAIETDRPGLLSCMVTRSPFVETMFSVRSDRAVSVEQAVEVTAEMDLEDNYDDYPPELFLDSESQDGFSYLSSSIKETMQSLLTFFTNQRSTTNSQSSSPEEQTGGFLSISPSSTQSVPIPGSYVNNRRSRKNFHSVGEDPFVEDEGRVAYQKLSASDLHITRLCVQEELQPNHLYSSSTKDCFCVDSDIAPLASVSPTPSSPVSQRLADVVTDITQPGLRVRERQRRSSIQYYLTEKAATNASGDEVAADESSILLPGISTLRRRLETDDSDNDSTTMSLAARRCDSTETGSSGQVPLRKSSDVGATNISQSALDVRTHRRVFSDGLPPEVIGRVHHSQSTSSLPLQSTETPPLCLLDEADQVSNLTDGSGNASDSIDTPMMAIGPDLDEDNDSPPFQVPIRVTRHLFTSLNFNLELESARLFLLVDDLYSRGLNELQALHCTQRLRRSLYMKAPNNGHAEDLQWRNSRLANDARVAESVTANAGEGTRIGGRVQLDMRDPLCDDEVLYEESEHEILAEFNSLLPTDDVIRHSPSLMKMLVICLRSPELADHHSPMHSSAQRLAVFSPYVRSVLDELNVTTNSRPPSSRRIKRLDSGEHLCCLRLLAKGAFSSKDSFSPPELRVLCDLYSKKHRAEQLVKQSYRCAGCSQPSTPQLARRFRFCEYFGCLYCELCHHGDSAMIIPGRILRQWNFNVFPVSVPAVEFLKRLFHRPLFRPPRSLFLKVRALRDFDDLRRQLALFIPFLDTCRKACALREAPQFQGLPRHYMWPEASKTPLYSIQDFSKLRWGKVMEQLRTVLRSCVEHVSICILCQAKGFICELCSQGKPIFPFELSSTYQCLECGACYHKICWETCPEGANSVCCPRCSRIEERRRHRMRQGSYDDSETSSVITKIEASDTGSNVSVSVEST